MYLFLLLPLTYCGTISPPQGVAGIWNSVANANVQAQYVFNFVLSTYLSSSGQLDVIFPIQYQSSLGNYALSCTPACSISGWTITFNFTAEITNGIQQTVSVGPILNPSAQGGTGNFILQTRRGANIIDQNMNFGIIGIANVIRSMVFGSVTLLPAGSSYAGDYTQYIISFKLTKTITQDSFMILTVPSQFTLTDFPVCVTYTIYGITMGGQLQCSTIGSTNQVLVNGISGTLTGLIEYGFLISMRNPYYGGTTGTFTLGIYRTNTQMMFEQVTGITGVTINAAQLANVSMTPVYQFINSQSRLVDYQVRFTPTFPIPAGCNIVLNFPVYMQIVKATDFQYSYPTPFQMHYVNYGLEDLSPTSPLGVLQSPNSALNFIQITNFQAMTMANEICVTVRVINPSAAGYTTPLTIYVYSDLTQLTTLLSDVLYAQAYVTAQTAGNQQITIPTGSYAWFATPRSGFFPNYIDIQSLPAVTAAANNALQTSAPGIQFVKANQQVIPVLRFNYNPSQPIPPLSQVIINVPSQLGISFTGISICSFALYSAGTFKLGPTAFSSCTYSQQTITMIFPSNQGMDTIAYPASYSPTGSIGQAINQFQIYLQNIIVSSTYNGTYYFDIQVIDQNLVTIYDAYSQWITIIPNGLSVYAVKHIPSTYSVRGILDVSFTSILLIPSSQQTSRASDLSSFIELQFPIGGPWANDLGTSLADQSIIPCYGVTNVIPYIGNQLFCFLTLGTATTPAKIKISNYRAINPNAQVRFLISGIINPSATYTMTLKIVQTQNRIFTILNQQSITAVLAAVAPAQITCTQTPQYSESRVGFVFNLNVSPCFTANVAAASIILVLNYNIKLQMPTYDTGFVQYVNTVTCAINNAQVYCIPLVGSDNILIVSPSTTLIASANPVITISNLQWPRYQQTLTNLLIQVIAGGAFTQNLVLGMPSAVPAQFNNIISIVPIKAQAFVDATYSFTFTPQCSIPSGSTILLYFPTYYNFLDSNIIPVFNQTGLSGSKIGIKVNIRLIKITGFETQPAGKVFTITATGVQNPTGYSLAQFTITVVYNNNFVLSQTNFYQFLFTTTQAVANVVINSITASIQNAQEQADYAIVFTPGNDIPKGGFIKITFPTANYKKFPSTVRCSLSQGITSFTSCNLNGNTFVIETFERYTTDSGAIQFSVSDITNPDSGISSAFAISTIFQSVTLAQTDSTVTGKTFTTQQSCNSTTVVKISFTPQNEGEEAAYNFVFISANAMNSTSQIVFKFPSQYDPLLGNNIQCIVHGGLIGSSYSCSAANRMVTLLGYTSYTPLTSNPINVTIFGIINGNAGNGALTDYIKIYIGQQGSTNYAESNPTAIQLTFISAPGWSQLNSMSVSTYAVRWNSTYNFTFQTNRLVPKLANQGAIYFNLPTQFEIPDGSITCSCTSTFATVLTCISYRNRITATGNFQDFSGALYVQFSNLINPLEQGTTDFFYIRTYDGLNFIIIERNFANLDPYKYSYVYPGPLIIVNNDKIISVERGTQVINIPVTVQYPSILNLVLIPSAQQFTMPSNISIPLGTTLTYFNISVPQYIADGTYTIQWTLTNELNPLFYTPVKRTIVKVTANANTKVIQTAIFSVPTLGNSLFTKYNLPAPPDTQLTYQFTLASAYFAIKLDVQNVTVQAGQSSFGFTVIYDKSVNPNASQVQQGYVNIVQGGINAGVYTLPVASVPFTIVQQDTVAPTFTSVQITQTTKTTVTFKVAVSENCMIYYLVALQGTPYPTSTQFQKMQFTYSSTKSQYGLLIGKSGIATVTNLISSTYYSLMFLAIDGGNNISPQSIQNFTTQTRPQSCQFTLVFNQESLNTTFIRNVTDTLALLFGINSSYIQQQKYYFNSRRMLQLTSVVSASLDLELAALENSDQFPDPVTVISQIANKTILFTAAMPTLNLTNDITSFPFVSYVPQFVVQPTIVYIDYQQCALSIQLSSYGWGFAVAIQYSANLTTPTPYQIMSGLDYYNRPTPFGSIEVSQPYKDFILAIQGLSPLTDYYIYVIGGSVQFRNPDLMSSNQIYIDRVISFAAPADPVLNINSGTILVLIMYFMSY